MIGGNRSFGKGPGRQVSEVEEYNRSGKSKVRGKKHEKQKRAASIDPGKRCERTFQGGGGGRRKVLGQGGRNGKEEL